MAYTTLKNYATFTFRDVRDNVRTRQVELGGLVILTDDNANDLHNASKSAVIKYVQNNVQSDDALAPDADSEVSDTARLYFELPDLEKGHFDIPDPHDEIFLATAGAGANIVKEYAVLAAAVAGTPEKAVANIIDDVLAGEILISDGEQPTRYLEGERVVG